MTRSQKSLITAAAVLLLATGCATNDPNRKAKGGGAIGAVAGAIIGHQSGSKNGKYVGAVVGAMTGAAVGNYMDRQQRQLEAQLAAEQSNRDIRVVRIDEETLKLDISSEATFDINSARLRNDFRKSLGKVSEIISEYDQTIVHVIGHTDNTGSISYNQQLSEKRAASVARYLGGEGVKRQRMRMAGYGEKKPLVANTDSSARSRNRRVEIFLKVIVKGRENEATRSPV